MPGGSTMHFGLFFNYEIMNVGMLLLGLLNKASWVSMSLTLLACSSAAFTYFVSFIHPTTPKQAMVKMYCITTNEAEYSREPKQQMCWNVFQIHRSAANISWQIFTWSRSSGPHPLDLQMQFSTCCSTIVYYKSKHYEPISRLLYLTAIETL